MVERQKHLHPARTGSASLGAACAAAALCALMASATEARAQAGEPPGAAEQQVDPRAEIDNAVAGALFDRGQLLFAKGDYANAKKMFVESLERSAKGPWADKSLAMLRSTNERLGIRDLEDGAPRVEKTPVADEPLDPYGRGDSGEALMDPYGEGGQPGGGENLVDPYGEPGGGGLGAREGGDGSPAGRGAVDAAPKTSARQMRLRAALSGGLWGAYTFGLLGDLFTGIDSSTTGEVGAFIAMGALAGAGAGYLYAKKRKPSAGDLALINSLGLYGTTAGLLLGVGIDPVENEAYSLQAAIGSAVGLGVGFYLASKMEMSRRRTWYLDLGAGAGVAATWAVYLLAADSSTNNDEQAAGFISIATMGAGAFLAYWMTRKMDREPERDRDDAIDAPLIAGLVTRSASGDWSAGTAMVRPMVSPALTGATRPVAWGVDLLGGRF